MHRRMKGGGSSDSVLYPPLLARVFLAASVSRRICICGGAYMLFRGGAVWQCLLDCMSECMKKCVRMRALTRFTGRGVC
eukprot:jgi/Botrbrau1/2768/Bobra.0164s0045.1